MLEAGGAPIGLRLVRAKAEGARAQIADRANARGFYVSGSVGEQHGLHSLVKGRPRICQASFEWFLERPDFYL